MAPITKFRPAPFLCAICDSDDYTMEWLKDEDTDECIEAHYTCHECKKEHPDFEVVIDIPHEAHHRRIGATYTALEYRWWRYKEDLK